jgi:hypothetical protein
MTLQADGTQMLLGRGKWYFDRGDGLRFLGNADSAEITPSVNKVEKFGSTQAAASKVASVAINQTHMLAINLNEYDPENLALALMGSTAALTQTTSTVTAEALTASAKLGRIYQTAKRNISSVLVKKGATTGVLGTDFDVEDAKLGLVRIMPGGAFADGDALTVDYSAGNVTATRVAAGTVGKIEGKLIFVGDPANGPAYDAEIWRANFTPNGAIAFITDNFGGMPLQAELLADATNHPSEPIYRLTKRT